MAGFDNDVMYANNVDFTGNAVVEGKVISNGQLLIGAASSPNIRVNTLSSTGGSVTITNGPGTINLEAGAAVPTTFTADSGSATPALNNLNILGLGETETSASGSTVSILSPRTAEFVVDPTLNNGTHQTIAAAIAAASSGDTIFVRPGTYTENLTLKAGVNLCAYTADAFRPNVTIVGNCVLTSAGTVCMSGIYFQTNSDFAIEVSGTAASIIKCINCYLDCSDNTGISLTSSDAGSGITMINCNGDVGTTGIKLYEVSGNGALFFDRCYFENPGATLTASTSSDGFVFWQFSYSELPMTTSGTAVQTASFSYFSTFATNQAVLTQGGSSSDVFRHCSFKSGTATPITISSGLNLQACHIETSNADVISGAGTLTYNAIHVNNTTASWTMSVSTQVARYLGQITLTKAFGANYVADADDYQVLRSDCIIGITSTAAERTVTMPASGMEIGQVWIIKDESAAAGTNNIVIDGNGANIVGATSAATYRITTNGGSASLYWDGALFNVF